MNNIYLDIETVGSSEVWVRDYVEKTVTHPGQMKKPETIAKWAEEEKPSAVAEALDKCAFDGAMNQIVCIGLAIDTGEVQTITSSDEGHLLTCFYDALSGVGFQSRFIGHNIIAFDIRVIRQRAMVWANKPPACIPFNAKPWDTMRVYDTMVQWDAKQFVKLDKLAKAFGIEGKTGDGSQVAKFWKDGKIDELAAYCKSDVELTRKIYQRMNYGD